MAANKGNRGLITFSMDVFATPTPTNSTEPTGGVHRPMQRFKIIMMPKCTGSIPNFVTMGKNIGVNMSTAGVMSIKIPTISKIIFMMSNRAILLSVTDNSPELISCGICSKESAHDMLIEAAIKSITTAVVEIGRGSCRERVCIYV